jgi:hypothetical protein
MRFEHISSNNLNRSIGSPRPPHDSHGGVPGLLQGSVRRHGDRRVGGHLGYGHSRNHLSFVLLSYGEPIDAVKGIEGILKNGFHIRRHFTLHEGDMLAQKFKPVDNDRHLAIDMNVTSILDGFGKLSRLRWKLAALSKSRVRRRA